jgi:hypothetical protein
MKNIARFFPAVPFLALSLVMGIPAVARSEAGSESNTLLPVNPALPVPTEARRLALEAAGAFVNDGFRIRDGEWSGTLSKGTPAFLRVTLFQGESYWFVGASGTPGAVLRITMYDGAGKPIKTEQWKDGAQGGGARCAAGIAPGKSGKYFVGVELMGSPAGLPVEYSVVYAYK